MGSEGYLPLFETKQAKGRFIYKIFIGSMFIAICMIWIYRATQLPQKSEDGRWGWIVLFGAEIWFSFYWILSQSLRWNIIYRYTFKDRLSIRYEKVLPKVDIFVCTADPVIEPPIMVVNTVLSVMAYDYPPEKLSVYLSDDGGSILTLYALFEASHFAKNWLPYCRKYNIEPRSPVAYLKSMPNVFDVNQSNDLASLKKLYEEMRSRIEMATKLGRVPEEIYIQHRGFSEWKTSYSSKDDHDTILQILIDGRNPKAKDVDGCPLPTVVYLAREKRPHHLHNFKAGAMNALIRVSSKISNGPIILNVDCDMYSNNSKSIREALCFFMDEKQGQDTAFVQFPQNFENVTNNELYGSSLRVLSKVELAGRDGFGGPNYIGTGCFHQREILCGMKYSKKYKFDWMRHSATTTFQGTVDELEEKAKNFASCTYEFNSQWGKEMGLKYRCPVEDVITGLAIQCRGWRSVYLNPKRKSFLGLAATGLGDVLVQQKRWSEGWLNIMLYHCPLQYGHETTSLGLRLCYCVNCLWSCNCFPTLCYCIVPSLYMLRGISLFPEITNRWFVPFAYVIVAKYTYSLGEFLWCDGTIKGWWNEQRMWLYKRTSSYLFAFIDVFLKLLSFSGHTNFMITAKVAANNDMARRYEKEVMEFGMPSPMFTVLTTLALVNLFCLWVVVVMVMVVKEEIRERMLERLALQILLCGVLVLINFPLFEAAFIRKDKGKMPTAITIKATFIAFLVCACFFMLDKI